MPLSRGSASRSAAFAGAAGRRSSAYIALCESRGKQNAGSQSHPVPPRQRADQQKHQQAIQGVDENIREVETELSVAQASTDMIATGVLDYSFIPDKQDPDAEVSEDDDVSDEVSKASS